MENFKNILTAQKEALTRDIDQMITEIKDRELILEGMKDRKSLAFKELRSIDKKLEIIDKL